MKEKDKFYRGKTKWFIPRKTFVLIPLPKGLPETGPNKLIRWSRKRNRLMVGLDKAKHELLILNEDLLDEWHVQQKQSIENLPSAAAVLVPQKP